MSQPLHLYSIIGKGLSALLFLLFCGQLELMGTVLAPPQMDVAPANNPELIDNLPERPAVHLDLSANDPLPSRRQACADLLLHSFTATLWYYQKQVKALVQVQTLQFQQQQPLRQLWSTLFPIYSIDPPEVFENRV